MCFVRAHADMRAVMTRESCAVGMRNAILGNHLNYLDSSEESHLCACACKNNTSVNFPLLIKRYPFHLIDSNCSQSGAWMTKSHSEKYRSSNQQRKRWNATNDKWTHWIKLNPRAVAKKPASFEKWPSEGFHLFAQLKYRARKQKFRSKIWARWKIAVKEVGRQENWRNFSSWAEWAH